jgi:hypothetical protein
VIDEADRMIEMGHFREIDEILEHIFVPRKSEFFEKDFLKISQQLEKNALKEEFFIKENGKKVKLSLSINSLPTDQLFEVPAGMFTITGADELQPRGKSGKKGAKSEKGGPEQERPARPVKCREAKLTDAETNFLAKLRRRIFFVSATLTREFKGTKYFIKKSRTEEDWKQKR